MPIAYGHTAKTGVAMANDYFSCSDPTRPQLGMTVTREWSSPVGPPTNRPVATIDVGQRLRHTIEFSDESTRSTRPIGVDYEESFRAATVWERNTSRSATVKSVEQLPRSSGRLALGNRILQCLDTMVVRLLCARDARRKRNDLGKCECRVRILAIFVPCAVGANSIGYSVVVQYR